MSKTQTGRMLALDLRAQRFGYSVQANNRLLDFGSAVFHSPKQARQRLRILLKAFQPAILVLDTGASRGWCNKSRTTSALGAFRQEARRRSVPVATISARLLRDFLSAQGLRSKYEFAALAATWFPQLASRVPPKRKCYEREPLVMTMFDSIALSAAYLKHRGDFD